MRREGEANIICKEGYGRTKRYCSTISVVLENGTYATFVLINTW